MGEPDAAADCEDTRASAPAVARTARWAAAVRARESERTDRLFEDPLARALAGEEGLTALRLSEERNPQRQVTAAFVAIRTRFFDEFARKATADGVRQVVLLGAGMDTRAFRLPWLPGTRLYELDHPELLREKDAVLSRERATPVCTRIPLPANLDEDWTSALLDAGLLPEERSLWLVEGVFPYLTEDTARKTLARSSQLAPPGSLLGSELVSQSYFTSPWTRAALETMAQHGFPWRFGTDEPEAFFAEHGWTAAVSQAGEPAAHFDRWTRSLIPRSNRAAPHSFLVAARRAEEERP